jgi:NitT/TauT family transport system permease protein
MFFDIALPGALPQILAGLKTSLGVALLVIVAAEFVGAKAGVGYLIWNSWQVFAVEKMYVGLMMTAVLGLVSAALFDLAERVFLPWRGTGRRGR